MEELIHRVHDYPLKIVPCVFGGVDFDFVKQLERGIEKGEQQFGPPYIDPDCPSALPFPLGLLIIGHQKGSLGAQAYALYSRSDTTSYTKAPLLV
jgi:hypothetical protein